MRNTQERVAPAAQILDPRERSFMGDSRAADSVRETAFAYVGRYTLGKPNHMTKNALHRNEDMTNAATATPSMSRVLEAATPEERERIFRFRYSVYVEEMNKRISEARDESKGLRDPIDDVSTLLYMQCGSEVIGTLRRTFLKGPALPSYYRECFSLDEFAGDHGANKISISSRLMVSPDWRNSRVALSLISEAYREARSRNTTFDFLLANTSLIPLYEHLGYRRYRRNFVDPDVGLLVPMIWVLADHKHLEQVRSPVLRVARKFTEDGSGTDWLARRFGLIDEAINSRICKPEQLFQDVRTLIPSFPANIPGFRCLEPRQLDEVMRAAVRHKAQPGEFLVRSTTRWFSVYVLLSGEVTLSKAPASAKGIGSVLGTSELIDGRPSGEQAMVTLPTDLLCVPASDVRTIIGAGTDTEKRFLDDCYMHMN